MYYIQTGQGTERLCIVTNVRDDGYWIATVQALEKLTVQYGTKLVQPEYYFYDALYPYVNWDISNKFTIPGGYSGGLSTGNGFQIMESMDVKPAGNIIGNLYNGGNVCLVDTRDFWLAMKYIKSTQIGQSSYADFYYLAHGWAWDIREFTYDILVNGATGERPACSHDLIGVFNLLDTVKIKGGTGTRSDPYILGL